MGLTSNKLSLVSKSTTARAGTILRSGSGREGIDYSHAQENWIKNYDVVVSFGVFIQGISVAVNRWSPNRPLPSVPSGEAKLVDVLPDEEITSSALQLRLREFAKLPPPTGRYFIFDDRAGWLKFIRSSLALLETGDKKLFVIGVGSDPLSHLSAKEHKLGQLLHELSGVENSVTMLRTRSPKIVTIDPYLEKFKRTGSLRVVVPIETSEDSVIRRYSPQETLISERLFAVDALRRLGYPVGLQVGPLLPYGDPVKDAPDFADLLIANSDFIEVSPLMSSDLREVKHLKATSVVKRLEADMKYAWLKSDAAYPLIGEILRQSPSSLNMPLPNSPGTKQLNLFAA